MSQSKQEQAMKSEIIQHIKQQRLQILDLLYHARVDENRFKPINVYLSDHADSLGDIAFNEELLTEEKLIERVGVTTRITSKGVFAYEKMLKKQDD